MVSLVLTDNVSVRVEYKTDAMEIPVKKQKNPGRFTILDIRGLTDELITQGFDFRQQEYSIDTFIEFASENELALIGVDGSTNDFETIVESSDIIFPDFTNNDPIAVDQKDGKGTSEIQNISLPFTQETISGQSPPGMTPYIIPDPPIYAISGIPNETGTFVWTVEVTDAENKKKRRTFTIVVQ